MYMYDASKSGYGIVYCEADAESVAAAARFKEKLRFSSEFRQTAGPREASLRLYAEPDDLEGDPPLAILNQLSDGEVLEAGQLQNFPEFPRELCEDRFWRGR